MQSRPVRIVMPYPFTHRFRIKSTEAGRTLIQHVVEKFPFKSEEEWKEKIEVGQLQVNGVLIQADYRLNTGDLISHFNPAVKEPSVPDEIEILEETTDWLAVFKPAPMPMHSGGRYHKNTLKSILEERVGYELFITHRLDAVTSGLVLLAKNELAADQISAAFRDDFVEKGYVAMIHGVPNQKKWSVDKPIRRKEGFVFECTNEAGAKSAFTEFEILQEFEDKALVYCRPKTGRTHQLRLHLAFSGHPIVDDDVYIHHGNPQFLQNKAIRLCNKKVVIPKLGIDLAYKIPDSFWTN